MLKSMARVAPTKVSVVGLGVGYSVACLLACAGFPTIGLDSNPKSVRNPRKDKSLDSVLKKQSNRDKIENHLKLTTDYSHITGSDVVIICVNTGDERQLVLGNVEAAVRSSLRVLKNCVNSPIILVYSTLPFGSSKRIGEVFKQEKVAMDEEIGYCHMPLMIAQGTTAFDFVNPPFLVFGSYSHETGKRARDFYADFLRKSILFNGVMPPTYVESPEVAELSKLVTNAFLSTKISFANMVGGFCEKAGVDGNKVLQIVGSHRAVGSKMLRPGYSFGGACFPRDLNSLIESFEMVGVAADILEATRGINKKRIESPFDELQASRNKTVLVLGTAYKAGVADTRSSPGLQLVEKLRVAGTAVETYDPQIDSKARMDDVLGKTKATSIIVTTPEPIFANIGKMVRRNGVRQILDYAGIIDPALVPRGVRLFKAGTGWLSESA